MDCSSQDGFGDAFASDLLVGGSSALYDPGDPPAAAGEAEDVESGFEPLPSPMLLAEARRLSASRRHRDRLFGSELFPNPGWNILVELFIAGEEGRNITIKSACVAAGVPQSTALRHIAHLIDVRLTARAQHPSDARSAYLKLTERGRAKMVAFISLSAARPGPPGA